MPALETKTWMALKGAVVDASPVAVAWPGDGYEPGAGPYLSVTIVPSPPLRQFVGEGEAHEQNGTLAMVLRTPLAGLVYEVALNSAGSIASAFPDGLRVKFQDVCVRVTSRAEVAGGFRDGSWWHIPINVPWQVLA